MLEQPQVPAGELRDIPYHEISVQPGFNPRKAFDPKELHELTEEIRAAGLNQPILVRPRSDGEEGYWVVAGERRYRACGTLRYSSMPALVRDLSDEQALRAAIMENLRRVDLTVAEEAIAARDMLDSHGGDKAATAAELCWSPQKLDARLLLLTASPAVLQAAAEKKIKVGHAELLAGLPEDKQDHALAIIIEKDISVATLREQVKGYVIPLALARFDTTQCSRCPFNTALQGSLFGDSVQGANCKNKACFSDLQGKALEAKRALLKDDFGTVALSTEKDQNSYVPLLVNGNQAVGEEQFKQCRQCEHYGALIHAKLDDKAGNVTSPLCFERICHATKVAAHAETLSEAEQANVARDDNRQGGATKASGNGASSSSRKSAPPKKKTTKASSKTSKTPAPAALSSAARKAMIPAYTDAAKQIVAEDHRVSLAMSILALEKLYQGSGIKGSEKAITAGAKPESVLGKLMELDEAGMVARIRACVERLVAEPMANVFRSTNDMYPNVIASHLVQKLEVDLAPYFTVTEAFLAAHTREGILALLSESKFDAWIAQQDDGAKKWKAILAMKKVELPKHIMASGFDWTGFVPASVKTVTPRSFVGV